MSIKVVLQRVRGELIDQVLDPEGKLQTIWPIDDESFPLLKYIDPYGSTVFNGKQMNELLYELRSLASRPSENTVNALLSRIQALAMHCRDNPHEYLRFVGD